MTKVDLIAKVAAEAELTKKDAEKAVAAVLDGITEALKAGDKLLLSASARLRPRERPARKGRNPRTKEEITIPATTAPAFKAGKALRTPWRNKRYRPFSMQPEDKPSGCIFLTRQQKGAQPCALTNL